MERIVEARNFGTVLALWDSNNVITMILQRYYNPITTVLVSMLKRCNE